LDIGAGIEGACRAFATSRRLKAAARFKPE
jgi:hypothetical protein